MCKFSNFKIYLALSDQSVPVKIGISIFSFVFRAWLYFIFKCRLLSPFTFKPQHFNYLKLR